MPDTPNFSITYPCMGPTIDCDAFAEFATDTEAAFVAVDAEAIAVTHTPFAIQETSTTPVLAVSTSLVFIASVNNFSSGVTVLGNTFVADTPGLYAVQVQVGIANSTLTMTSGRVSIHKNGVLANAIKRKPQVSFPSVSNMNLTAAINLVAGDTISFQYLWTGTGALTGPITAAANIQRLSTP